MGEYDASGNVIAEHVYLKNIPVAVVKGVNTYFVHTDYLNTPRAISNSSGTVVWKWDNTNAYGYNPANETVSGTAFEYNPRFAGQYFDKETGLHYNLNRMYNPELARYMQPDPIGVNGGMNIYSYVENNPLNMNDSNGLVQMDAMGNVKFWSSGEEFEYVSTNDPSIKIKALIGYIKTDRGTHVPAYKRIGPSPGKENWTADCHGVTFAKGQFWIDNKYASLILNDEYYEVDKSLKRDGDVIIYEQELFNGKVEIAHSLTLQDYGLFFRAYGKGGNEPAPYT